jgi:beta-galactosidase
MRSRLVVLGYFGLFWTLHFLLLRQYVIRQNRIQTNHVKLKHAHESILNISGSGPHESYVDRKSGARQGVYSSSVEVMHVPYMAPSHNGGRADVHWVKLVDESNSRGLHVTYRSDAPSPDLLTESSAPTNKQRNVAYSRPASTDGAQMELCMYTDSALTDAKHQHDLTNQKYGVNGDTVFLRLDTAHMGVGGDNSWLPAVHPQFYVNPQGAKWQYAVDLVPVSK